MWKKKIDVQVMSRMTAVQYCLGKNRRPSVIISISDPSMEYTDAPFCSRDNKVKAILPLCFCDADAPGKDVYGLDVEEDDLMSDVDAMNVVRFVKANKDKTIIVHCDAGISRSAGVAAAIVQYYTGNAHTFFESGQYSPNMWCYSKVLMAFLDA